MDLSKNTKLFGMELWAISALIGGIGIALVSIFLEKFKDEFNFKPHELLLYLSLSQGILAFFIFLYCSKFCNKDSYFYIERKQFIKKINNKFLLFLLFISLFGMIIKYSIRTSQVLTPNIGLTNAILSINIIFVVFMSYFFNNKKISISKILGVIIVFIGIFFILKNDDKK